MTDISVKRQDMHMDIEGTRLNYEISYIQSAIQLFDR